MKKEELVNALTRVKIGLGSDSYASIDFGSFYFTGKEVIAFNDSVYASHPIQTDFIGSVSADKFLAYVEKVKAKNGEIEITEKDNELIIQSGKAKSGFAFVDTIDDVMSDINESIGSSKWKTIPDNFLDAIQTTSFCCSSDHSLPLLTCVFISGKSVLATNRYRAIIHKLSSKMKPFLLPAATVPFLSKLNITKYSVTDAWVHFKTKEKSRVSVRIYPHDDFPSLDAMFEVKGKKFSFADEMDSIIDSAIIFIPKGVDREQGTITVTVDKKNIEVKAQSQDAWYTEKVKNKSKIKKPISFEIHPVFLKDILKRTRVCEICNDDADVIVFKSEDWEYCMAIQMI